METGGYKGRSRVIPKADLHQLMTQFLGVSPDAIVCEYGMSELSSQAYDAIAGRMADASSGPRAFQFPPWAHARLVSPETGAEVADGETGLIQICDLANVGSVMAVQTEDLGVRRGNGFELLGRATLAEPRGCSLMAV
jgi:acyl-CoA synthetase (AMP-forming)/AMP-acid ligase II